MTEAISDSGQHGSASPVERLLQMLFTEPQTLTASNELALTILHQLSPFTNPKRTKKPLRRHSVSMLQDTASPVERLLKVLFFESRTLSGSNKRAQNILLSLSRNPFTTFKGISKPQRRDSVSDPEPETPNRPSWRDEAYWLDQLERWEPSRYRKTRVTMPDYEWSRRAEELYHSLVEECFKAFEASADAKCWLEIALPMVLWCIETPTAGDFSQARSHGLNMVPFIAREIPDSYNRLIRHLDNLDQKAGEPLPPGYQIFLEPDESTYLRLAGYYRRIKRSHEAQCFFLREKAEGRV